MLEQCQRHKRFLTEISLVLCCLVWGMPAAVAKGPLLVGKWQVTITIPASPGSNQKVSQTLTLNVSPMDSGSLNGRLTLTDQGNRTVSGVWREVGKMISITYEPACDSSPTVPCATLILLGRVKGGGTIVKGQVVIEWDSPDGRNPALYETDNGKFSGGLLEQ